jgi:hypothetical protein
MKVEEIEAKYGKPLPQVLIALYEELGKRSLVSKRLGVAPRTIQVWQMANNLHQATVLRPSVGYRMES